MTALKFKITRAGTTLPAFATEGAACFDIRAVMNLCEGVTIWPGTSHVFNTGLVPEIPAGMGLLIYSRSGHGFNDNVRLSNGTGIIDSDYRGEIKVKLACDELRIDQELHEAVPFKVKHGDRIAQAMLIPLPKYTIEQAFDVSETARGAGGFGSTGAQ